MAKTLPRAAPPQPAKFIPPRTGGSYVLQDGQLAETTPAPSGPADEPAIDQPAATPGEQQ